MESDGRAIWAVEKDPRCLDALAELSAAFPGRLTVIAGDALNLESWRLGAAPRKLVANLPYNVGTPLLLTWLKALAEDPGCLASLTLMFQKEVAERLLAQPRTSAYGRLSIVTQWLCHVEGCFELPPGAFRPPPKVTSKVVLLTPRAMPLYPVSLASLERVTAAAFGQRRKMLRQSLKSLGRDPKVLLQAAEIEETARAETLSIAEFCRLAEALDRERG